jgi:hypothetical protein
LEANFPIIATLYGSVEMVAVLGTKSGVGVGAFGSHSAALAPLQPAMLDATIGTAAYVTPRKKLRRESPNFGSATSVEFDCVIDESSGFMIYSLSCEDCSNFVAFAFIGFTLSARKLFLN